MGQILILLLILKNNTDFSGPIVEKNISQLLYSKSIDVLHILVK